MRVLVIHDKTGNITGVVTSPPDAPPIQVEPPSDDELVTEVDLEPAGFDPDSVDADRLLERLREHRIDLSTDGKLVAK